MIVKMGSIAIAAAIISGLAAPENSFATCSSPIVTYQATGRFGANPISGRDVFKLAGQPFTIYLYACESLQPSQTGSDYAVYSGVELRGVVKSGLIQAPYTIRPAAMTFVLVQPPSGPDLIQLDGNLTVFGSLIFIRGSIAVPAGTLTSTSIAPFTKVSIVTTNSGFSYAYPSWRPTTVYAVGEQIVDSSGDAQKVLTAGVSGATAPAWNETTGGTTTDGTVVWSCEGPSIATELAVLGTATGSTGAANSPNAGAQLDAGAAQVITAHANGTQSVRPLQGAPIDLSASSDRVMLQFYASGVRDASEVHVQIAGQEVPVFYSGAAGHFPELDEVIVEVPRSLAGMGQVDVVLTADGQAASSVLVAIQ
jgi:uncharacterized protein (TIGR03437 family)